MQNTRIPSSVTLDIIADAYCQYMKHDAKKSIQLIQHYKKKNTSPQVRKWCTDAIESIRECAYEYQNRIQSILQAHTPLQEEIENIFVSHARVLFLECEGLKHLIQTYESRQ